jgi:hypothetical protein
MDGLDKLIEMFEKRFGKFWGDTLLLIFVLGAAALAIRSIVDNLVSPVVPYGIAAFNYVSGMNIVIRNRPFAFDDIIAAALTVVLLIGSGYASYRMGHSYGFYRRRAEKLLPIAEDQQRRIAKLEMENASLRAANAHSDEAQILQAPPNTEPGTSR